MKEVTYVEIKGDAHNANSVRDLEMTILCGYCANKSQIMAQEMYMKSSKARDTYVRCPYCQEEISAYKVALIMPQVLFQELRHQSRVPINQEGMTQPVNEMTDDELFSVLRVVNAEIELRLRKRLP